MGSHLIIMTPKLKVHLIKIIPKGKVKVQLNIFLPDKKEYPFLTIIKLK